MRLLNVLKRSLHNKLHQKPSKFVVFYLFACICLFTLPFTVIDEELQPYVNWYLGRVEVICPKYKYYRPSQIVIVFDKLGRKYDRNTYTIGSCWKRYNRYDIIIDRDNWEIASEADRYSTVAHELTHCMFYEDHSEDDTNFMYFESVPMSLDELQRQVDEYLRKTCL